MKLYFCLAIGIGFILFAIYQLMNIRKAEAVTGILIGYEEKDETDANGNFVTSRYPIYTFTHNGKRFEYRSMVSSLPFFAKDETHTLYVNENGKVFDKQATVGCIVIGILAMVIAFL